MSVVFRVGIIGYFLHAQVFLSKIALYENTIVKSLLNKAHTEWGGGEAKKLEPLWNKILAYWKPISTAIENIAIHKDNSYKSRVEQRFEYYY